MNNLFKALILVSTLVLFGCNENHNEHKVLKEANNLETYYTCSMHPKVKEDKPGKCPICHMNLTKIEIELDDKANDHAEQKREKVWQCRAFPEVTSGVPGPCPIDGTDMVEGKVIFAPSKVIAKVKLRKSQLNHFKPDYFTVSKMKMTKKIRLLGSVMQSEERESSISARISGRVERVYVKSTGSFVRAGDPVVDLYSPDLITAGEEYLLAKKSYEKSPTQVFKDILNQSEQRLVQWGVQKGQFSKWAVKNKVPRRVTVYSKETGIVRKRYASVGKYFKEGQNLFELSDLSSVWVEMDVYESDSSLVRLGQKVELEFNALPGERVTGALDFISPVLNSNTRTLKIRATIANNSGKLKPGMIANAILKIEFEKQPLVVPRSAVIDTGVRKVVWVREAESRRKFKAKVINTGHESEGYIEIKSGLKDGEQVVIEGNFLLDAQAQLFGGYTDHEQN